MRVRSVFLGLILLISIAARGQTGDLPRRAAIGLAVAAADPAGPENRETNPPTVKTIVPGSAGEEARFEAGDVLLKLDGVPVSSSTAFRGPSDVMSPATRFWSRCCGAGTRSRSRRP